MIYKVIFSAPANKDVEESISWYDEQLIGLGDDFMAILNNAIEIISINPEAFPRKRNHLRQMPVNKFPFIIVYEIEKENIIRILRVFHTSRNPKLRYRRK
jgi:plasmid stabilization system protein ParE